MAIRRWHWGKMVMLWAWGGALATFPLADFLTTPVKESPVQHLLELTGTALLLAILSVTTWIWLGGKEAVPPSSLAGDKSS